jgi:hypothetical protein
VEALERWAKEMREREDTERAEKALGVKEQRHDSQGKAYDEDKRCADQTSLEALAVKEHPHPPPAPQPAPAAP